MTNRFKIHFHFEEKTNSLDTIWYKKNDFFITIFGMFFTYSTCKTSVCFMSFKLAPCKEFSEQRSKGFKSRVSLQYAAHKSI